MASAFRARARTLPQPEHQPSTLVKLALFAVMVLGSLAMWVANPAIWLWITAHLQDGTQARMGPYGLMLLGILLKTPQIRVILPWRRSLRGGRSMARETDGRLPVNALDVIMTVSVILAVATFSTWYIVSNPVAPSAGGVGPAKH